MVRQICQRELPDRLHPEAMKLAVLLPLLSCAACTYILPDPDCHPYSLQVTIPLQNGEGHWQHCIFIHCQNRHLSIAGNLRLLKLQHLSLQYTAVTDLSVARDAEDNVLIVQLPPQLACMPQDTLILDLLVAVRKGDCTP